jgi:hypothetical protein
MTRFGAVFWLVLVLVAGFTTFRVKYAVQDIEDELRRVRKQTIAEQQEIRVLTAEWTYLNQPERLAALNQHFLQLTPVAPKQLQRSITDITLRAPPAPDPAIAATTDPAAPQDAASAAPVNPAAAAPAKAAAPVAAPVQLAKVGAVQTLGSLDALIAQIAEAH